MKEIKNRLDENQAQLDNLRRANPDMKDQDVLVQSLDELERRVKSESKLIAKDNNPTITYAYLLDICENYCPDLRFDFKFVESGQRETANFNSYSIIGRGALTSLYTFIYQLENQFMLYIIKSIRLSGVEPEEDIPSDYVYFSLVITAFYEENAVEVDDIPFRYLRYKNLDYHPFIPRIHGPIPDVHEERFIDIYASRMIGLTPDKVFILDKNGKIQVIVPGDKIAYGYLDRINWEDQNAVFITNKTGLPKEYILILRQYED
ncbi:MAG: hypothetical protein K9N09_06430 [Candidatus Cloacimonetes bacterium]|nr:hypothetical protein [Candidatus Cloacimonadota bacterium]MCF7813643.1 hypothetical protein [Candidatus Cloacimonadota bacterium]MCF7868322.1 hypothetical protein [Candidatus Cloacimonadota bacterium]